MKPRIVILLLSFLLLTSCGAPPLNAGTPNPSPAPADTSSAASSAEEETQPKINRLTNALQQLDADRVSNIRYLDEKTAYIFASKQDDRGLYEGILARYNIEQGTIKVLHREFTKTEADQKLTVEAADDGTVVAFNGLNAYVISPNDSVEYIKIENIDEHDCRAASLNVKNKLLAYREADTREIYVLDANTEKKTFIYPYIVHEPEPGATKGDEMNSVTSGWYPKISPNGEFVMFQKATPTEPQREYIVCKRVDGSDVFETARIGRISRYQTAYWLGDKIFTWQTEDDPYSSLFTIYNEKGIVEKTFTINLRIDFIEETPNIGANEVCFYANDSFNTGEWKYNLGLINLETGTSEVVYTDYGVIFSQDLSPSGKKMIWIEDNDICELNISDILQTDSLYDQKLEKQFKDAEPIQKLSINSDKFPDLVADVFEKMIFEENNTTSTTDTLSEITLQSIELWGDENEFCVTYYFSGVCGANNPIIAAADSFLDGRFYNAVKTIRVRKEESGEYAIIAQGGGPLAYGLEKVDINIENLY